MLVMRPDSLCLKYFARELRSRDSAAYLSSLALNVIFTKRILSSSLLFHLTALRDKVIQAESECKSAAILSSGYFPVDQIWNKASE